MKFLSLLAISLFAGAGIGSAQSPRGTPAGDPSNRPAPLKMLETQTVTGILTAVDLAYGAQFPTITVDQTVIKVAPPWFFAERDFELSIGEHVSVVAAPCSLATDPYLYALTISKTETGETLVLRDSAGLPVWSSRGFARGSALTAGFRGAFDPASVRTISGTIERVSMGAGIQMPMLSIRTRDGSLVVMKIGPERVLLAADFELKPGDPVTAVIAASLRLRENVALQLTNAAGITLTLRQPDGTPNWN